MIWSHYLNSDLLVFLTFHVHAPLAVRCKASRHAQQAATLCRSRLFLLTQMSRDHVTSSSRPLLSKWVVVITETVMTVTNDATMNSTLIFLELPNSLARYTIVPTEMFYEAKMYEMIFGFKALPQTLLEKFTMLPRLHNRLGRRRPLSIVLPALDASPFDPW